MRHPLRLAAGVAVAALTLALLGPPLIPRSDDPARPGESSGFRYLPGAAFEVSGLPRVTGVESRRWTGTFSQGERFELVTETLPTGRYYLLYSVDGAVETTAPARLECGLAEAESGIPLEPQPTVTLRSGDGRTDQEAGAMFDLPGMTVVFRCVIDSLVFGSIDISDAQLSIYAAT